MRNTPMQQTRSAHIHVCPTVELRNVASKRLNELKEKKEKQNSLLQTLHCTVVNTHFMQQYVEARDNAGSTEKHVESCNTETSEQSNATTHHSDHVLATHTLSFNEQVNQIVSLQDQILVDYLRVCNIRLRSQQPAPACQYIQEAADYLSILTAIINT
jgi:hypothetical protein